jgi:hypothetical protein
MGPVTGHQLIELARNNFAGRTHASLPLPIKACDLGNGQEYLSIAETGTSPFDLA